MFDPFVKYAGDIDRIERRPGGAHADRGHNPMTRLVRTGLVLLKAGASCRFCLREATTLIARGTTPACPEHATRYNQHVQSKRGF